MVLGALVLVLGACRQRSAPEELAPRPAPPSPRSRAPVAASVSEPAPAPGGSVWSSRRACEALLAARPPAPRSGSARLGTWNVRWFPDGRPGKRAPSGGGTDVAWLACAIAWLDVDALAVQELKAHPRARARTDELLAALDRHTGGRWRITVDDCRGGDASQHVGILWNERRVRASEPITLASLNPHREPCKDQLRPGLARRLVFPGGLDLYFVSVHFKSGSERRSLDLRRRSFEGLPAAVAELRAAAPEDDVIVAGDFNTMGCRRCSPAIPAAEELASASRLLAGLQPSFRRVDADATCTERYRDGVGLLDHFVVSSATRELAANARAHVSGYCADARCRFQRGRSDPPAYQMLSDHCPVVLELSDRDLD